MKIYTDGSYLKYEKDGALFECIAWTAILDPNWIPKIFKNPRNVSNILVLECKCGGTNINAEMLAIMDLFKYLSQNNVAIMNYCKENDERIEIVTDSKTSIQIINLAMNSAIENYESSENYAYASRILQCIERIKELYGIEITIENFKHVRGHGQDSNTLPDEIWGNYFADALAQTKCSALRELNRK